VRGHDPAREDPGRRYSHLQTGLHWKDLMAPRWAIASPAQEEHQVGRPTPSRTSLSGRAAAKRDTAGKHRQWHHEMTALRVRQAPENEHRAEMDGLATEPRDRELPV
jgi:hypothetical protein